MKLTKLNTPGAHPLPLQITTRAVLPAIVLLASLGFCERALAQNVQPRPVARLLSAPVGDESRPRRVALEVKTSSVDLIPLDEANAIERRAFAETNVAREKNGLPQLTWDPQLCHMAKAHSEQMASLGYFSHETPEGSRLKDRARENGILHFRVIGENIAYNKGYDDPGGFAVERWLTSSGHRANILYVGFQASAIGSYVAADGSTYLTQIFIAR